MTPATEPVRPSRTDGIDAVPAAPGAGPLEAAVLPALADCTRRLAALAGIACLLEDERGRLLAHHFATTDVSPLLVRAVLVGSTEHIHGQLRDRRTTGLLLGAPVIEAQLDETAVLLFHWPGAVILLVTERTMSLSRLREPLERLAVLTSITTRAAVASCLSGGPLPVELASAQRFWVARLDGRAPAELILASLPDQAGRLRVSGQQCDSGAYAVLAGRADAGEQEALNAVAALHRQMQRRLAQPLTLALSEACTSARLPRGRSQADVALSALRAGECASIRDLRARMALQSLAKTLAQIADLGPDPLDALVEHDRRRRGVLAASLLAWLNSLGDTRRAADSLGVHVNTLRYRVRRAEELLAIDLRDDHESRALLHLQLLTAGEAAVTRER